MIPADMSKQIYIYSVQFTATPRQWHSMECESSTTNSSEHNQTKMKKNKTYGDGEPMHLQWKTTFFFQVFV